MNKLQFKIPKTINFNIDAALRYWPLFNEIKNSNIPNPKILEVGCGPGGITQFMDYSITGLDMVFDKNAPGIKFIKQNKGSILKLPFTDKSFDIVICADVLEHLKKENRKKAVKELVRVGNKRIIIAFPQGKEAENADKKLNVLYHKKTKHDHPWIWEHLKNGLPKIEDVQKEIKNIIPRENFKIQSNLNIKAWYLMHCFFTIHKELLLKRLGKKMFFIIIYITFLLFRNLNFSPAYRKIIVVKK